MLPKAKTHIPDPKTRARLLAALYIAQEQYGWLSPEAIQRVAGRLGLTPGQVYSTASFYTMFKLQPQGDYRIQVCEGLVLLPGGRRRAGDRLYQAPAGHRSRITARRMADLRWRLCNAWLLAISRRRSRSTTSCTERHRSENRCLAGNLADPGLR